MPIYEYRCLNCRKTFSITETIGQHGRSRPKCPACGSRKVEQVYSAFFAQTAKKS
jgi:putative FmdB family regulatory protein